MSRIGTYPRRRSIPGSATAGLDLHDVIWFYERKGEHLRCEIRS